jgi:hypothetical protein
MNTPGNPNTINADGMLVTTELWPNPTNASTKLAARLVSRCVQNSNALKAMRIAGRCRDDA